MNTMDFSLNFIGRSLSIKVITQAAVFETDLVLNIASLGNLVHVKKIKVQ